MGVTSRVGKRLEPESQCPRDTARGTGARSLAALPESFCVGRPSMFLCYSNPSLTLGEHTMYTAE